MSLSGCHDSVSVFSSMQAMHAEIIQLQTITLLLKCLFQALALPQTMKPSDCESLKINKITFTLL